MATGNSFRLRLIEPTKDLLVASKVSNLLMATSSDLAISRGGHVPDDIVTNIIQRNYTTLESVVRTFSDTGYRGLIPVW